jgi:hypothetical protein
MQNPESNLTALKPLINQLVSEVVSPLAQQLKRIADHLDQSPPEVVGTRYLADKLDVSTQWIADQIRAGKIPKNCIAGGGDGRQWKLYRDRIDEWLEHQTEL